MKIENKLILDLEKLTEVGFFLSQNFGKESTNDLHKKLSSIFLSKAIPNSLSILKLIPGSKFSKEKIPDDFYDFSSIGALARNFIELTNQHFYFCLQNVSQAERDFRLVLYRLHQIRELQKIITQFNDLTDSRFQQLESEYNIKRSELLNNIFFLSLSQGIQKDLRNGKKSMHLNNQEIIALRSQELSLFQGMYKLLSNYTHTSPLSLNHIGVASDDSNSNLPIVMVELIVNYLNDFFTEFLWSINKKWNVKFKNTDHQKFIDNQMEIIKNDS